jgi:hypothetical protein
LNAGDVILWRAFEFPDGGRADKLFIIANEQRNGEHLAFIVTSQQKAGREQKPGCYEQLSWFFLQKGTSSFVKPTWVTFDDGYEFLVDELEELRERGVVALLREKLQPATLRAVINCFCRTLAVTPHHRWLLE